MVSCKLLARNYVMKENVIKNKSFLFAIRIVKLYKYLCEHYKEYVLSKQLLRCGTSVGAMIKEAEHAESSADFKNKLSIAQKEINETIYWLELLKATDYLTTKNLKVSMPMLLKSLKLLQASSKQLNQKINN